MFGLRNSAARFADAGRRFLLLHQNTPGVRGIRIGNTEIPDNKKLLYSLQYIKGIGKTTARQVLCGLGIGNKLSRELTGAELETLRNEVLTYNIGHNVDKDTASYVKRLVDIDCYRGIRHVDGLPVRGQRTRTNARTRKRRPNLLPGIKMRPR